MYAAKWETTSATSWPNTTKAETIGINKGANIIGALIVTVCIQKNTKWLENESENVE